MDRDSLINKLKWCKREVQALKIAHEKGLGAASFYSATDFMDYVATSYNNNFLKITVQFDELPYTPYCQCYISSAQYFQPFKVSYDEANNQMVFLYEVYLLNVSIPVNVKAIATAEISSITMEATTPYA